MLEEIVKAIELLDNLWYKAQINIDIAKKINQKNQQEQALKFIEEALNQTNIVSSQEDYSFYNLK